MKRKGQNWLDALIEEKTGSPPVEPKGAKPLSTRTCPRCICEHLSRGRSAYCEGCKTPEEKRRQNDSTRRWKEKNEERVLAAAKEKYWNNPAAYRAYARKRFKDFLALMTIEERRAWHKARNNTAQAIESRKRYRVSEKGKESTKRARAVVKVKRKATADLRRAERDARSKARKEAYRKKLREQRATESPEDREARLAKQRQRMNRLNAERRT